MVRQKTRWMLVQLDGTDDFEFPARKTFLTALRASMEDNFGLVSTAASSDLQVRFIDSSTRLILLRVNRKDCGMVRASLTLLTEVQPNTSNIRESGGVVASVLSLHGTARTAKLALIACLKKSYRERIAQKEGNSTSGNMVLLTELREKWEAVQRID